MGIIVDFPAEAPEAPKIPKKLSSAFIKRGASRDRSIVHSSARRPRSRATALRLRASLSLSLSLSRSGAQQNLGLCGGKLGRGRIST